MGLGLSLAFSLALPCISLSVFAGSISDSDVGATSFPSFAGDDSSSNSETTLPLSGSIDAAPDISGHIPVAEACWYHDYYCALEYDGPPSHDIEGGDDENDTSSDSTKSTFSWTLYKCPQKKNFFTEAPGVTYDIGSYAYHKAFGVKFKQDDDNEPMLGREDFVTQSNSSASPMTYAQAKEACTTQAKASSEATLNTSAYANHQQNSRSSGTTNSSLPSLSGNGVTD
jgi:hypothetical protein